MSKTYVTKTFLPPIEEYEQYLKKIWDSGQLTNQGPLLREFEDNTRAYLGTHHFQFVSNGTIALQLALEGLGLAPGEIITTPFSYVATTSAILWEKFSPVFVDIDPLTLCIDPDKIEAAITKETKAILAVHVFGNPCDVEKIDTIAKKHKLKVIYDAAHAFGVKYKGKSLLGYGDISTCSFHSTKLFHTIEGGGVVARDTKVHDRIELMKRFGHNGDDQICLGINAKASEFQAAMGLCNLKYIDKLIDHRRRISSVYDKLLGSSVTRIQHSSDIEYNYAYYPAIFKSEEELKQKVISLNENDVFPRRYFYPSLNTLPYLGQKQSVPISEDISRRILCLPLYAELEQATVKRICKIINT